MVSPFILDTALPSKSVSLEEMDFWAVELLNENMGFETQKGMKVISRLALPPSFLLNRFAVAEVFLRACVCVHACAHTGTCLPTLCFNGCPGFQEAFLFLGKLSIRIIPSLQDYFEER